MISETLIQLAEERQGVSASLLADEDMAAATLTRRAGDPLAEMSHY
jgi:hypothetical protein